MCTSNNYGQVACLAAHKIPITVPFKNAICCFFASRSSLFVVSFSFPNSFKISLTDQYYNKKCKYLTLAFMPSAKIFCTHQPKCPVLGSSPAWTSQKAQAGTLWNLSHLNPGFSGIFHLSNCLSNHNMPRQQHNENNRRRKADNSAIKYQIPSSFRGKKNSLQTYISCKIRYN